MPLRPGESEESLRAWLEELVTGRWGDLVGFVLGATPVKRPAAAHDVIEDTVLKILAGVPVAARPQGIGTTPMSLQGTLTATRGRKNMTLARPRTRAPVELTGSLTWSVRRCLRSFATSP